MRTRPPLPKVRWSPRRRRRGSVLLFAVLMLPVMLCGVAVMTEYGNVAWGRSRAQTAADAAAKAGAYQVARGTSAAKSAAGALLGESGLTVGQPSGLVTVTASRVTYGRWDVARSAFVALAQDSSEGNAVRVELDVTVAALAGTFAGLRETRHTVSATAFLPGVLLAVDNAKSPRANDVTMIRQIRKAGYPVRLISVYDLEPDMIEPGEVLFLSSSVGSAQVDPALFDIEVPIVCGETNLYDSFGFTNGADGDTHTTVRASRHDVELDLRKLGLEEAGDDVTERDELASNWRQAWRNWWDDDGRHRTNYNRMVQYYGDGKYDAADEADRVEYKASVSSGNALSGYAKREALGRDAVVLSTLDGDPMKATTFWFDAGSTLGDGTVAQHKRAGIFTRTTEYSGSQWQYNQQGYDLLAYTIRWMLSDEESRTRLVQ